MTWTNSAGIGRIVNVLRWKGGWIAQVTGADASSALFVSSDASRWHRLPDAVPPVAVAAVSGDRLIATNFVSSRLRVYASSDAETWHEVTRFAPAWPLAVAGSPTVFVAAELGLHDRTVYWSQDGEDWQVSAAPSGLEEAQQLLYAQGRFLLFGQRSDGGAIWWSADGRVWNASVMGSAVSFGGDWRKIYVGAGGIIGEAWSFVAPNAEWYRSADGLKWELSRDFAPLGAMTAPGDPPTQCPNGFVASDGERMLAYRWDGAAWTSTDGRAWSSLRIDPLPTFGEWKTAAEGCIPQETDAHLLPRGLMVTVDQKVQYGEAN